MAIGDDEDCDVFRLFFLSCCHKLNELGRRDPTNCSYCTAGIVTVPATVSNRKCGCTVPGLAVVLD